MVSKRRYDPKSDALVESGTINPHANRVDDPLFAEHDFFDARDLLQVKYEMIRRVESEGQPVTTASQAFGFSRPSFYKARASLHEHGLAGLLPKKSGPQAAHKLNHEVMGFVRQVLATDETLGAVDLANEVNRKFGFTIHPRSIERALKRQEKKIP